MSALGGPWEGVWEGQARGRRPRGDGCAHLGVGGAHAGRGWTQGFVAHRRHRGWWHHQIPRKIRKESTWGRWAQRQRAGDRDWGRRSSGRLLPAGHPGGAELREGPR